MDAFITYVPQKKKAHDHTIHGERIALLERYLSAGENVVVCGPTGVGKTFLLEQVFDESNSIELTPELLKQKHSVVDFMRESKRHAYVDGESADTAVKALVDGAVNGGRVTRGSLVITRDEFTILPNFQTLFIPRHGAVELLRLVPGEMANCATLAAAERADGNIRDFFSYARECSDDKDTFLTPKEIVHDMLTNKDSTHSADSITEHGHAFSIFQENYLSSTGVDVDACSMSFSDADIFDEAMYQSGCWDLMPYFVSSALHKPKHWLGEPIPSGAVRAGSFWTKDGNRRMRQQRTRAMRVPPDVLELLHTYARFKLIQPLIDHGIQPRDFDVINHLRVGETKLKTKDVGNVKKLLKAHYESLLQS